METVLQGWVLGGRGTLQDFRWGDVHRNHREKGAKVSSSHEWNVAEHGGQRIPLAKETDAPLGWERETVTVRPHWSDCVTRTTARRQRKPSVYSAN